jgi:hypothetical protein
MSSCWALPFCDAEGVRIMLAYTEKASSTKILEKDLMASYSDHSGTYNYFGVRVAESPETLKISGDSHYLIKAAQISKKGILKKDASSLWASEHSSEDSRGSLSRFFSESMVKGASSLTFEIKIGSKYCKQELKLVKGD